MRMSTRSLRKRVYGSINGIRRTARRMTRSPFRDRSNGPKIIHGSHHKVGTSWMQSVLRMVADEYGLVYQGGGSSELRPETDIFLQSHSAFDLSALPRFKGSHMIRDPRDVIVSGYHYHLWTKESWANIPMSEFPERARRRWHHVPFDEAGSRTYKEFLNSLDKERGLAIEICRAATTLMPEITNWNYEQPEFFEMRYEQLMEDEASVFARLFRHYEFHEEAVSRCVELADRCSFRNRAGREVGTVATHSHMRSGRTGQWREELSEDNVALFKSLTGDAVVNLGYERGIDWS